MLKPILWRRECPEMHMLQLCRSPSLQVFVLSLARPCLLSTFGAGQRCYPWSTAIGVVIRHIQHRLVLLGCLGLAKRISILRRGDKHSNDSESRLVCLPCFSAFFTLADLRCSYRLCGHIRRIVWTPDERAQNLGSSMRCSL